MRTFVAVPLERELRFAAGELQSDLRRFQVPVRMIPPENLHITILFLGEVDPSKAVDLGKALEEQLPPIIKPFQISFQGLGAFPSLKSARVLWIGMTQGEDQMQTLTDQVRTIARPLGLKWDPKPFKGHLTIGRPTSKMPSALKIPPQYMNHAIGSMEVNRVIVYRSDLSPQGSKYTEIATAKF
jgi:2'-5' RNA ligase